MDNKGRITVFLSLMVCSMLALVTTVLKVADIRNARAKAAMCGRGAVSSIRATYNNYIYDNYHILLFDKNCSGKGEGYIEERIKERLEENLGDDYTIGEVAINSSVGITDNDFYEFKSQIADYMKYATVDYGVDTLLGVTGGNDGTLSDSLNNNLNQAGLSTFNPDDFSNADPSEEGEVGTALMSSKDPRNLVKHVLSGALLYFVLPEGMEPSATCIDLSETLSHGSDLVSEDFFSNGINTNFNDLDDLKDDLACGGKWKDELIDAGAAVTYARGVFNSAVDGSKNDETVLAYEMEYLIAGRASDADNLEKVIKNIIAIRLPVNFAFLCSCSNKMNLIRGISAPLSIETLIPEPVLRYLIAGCWSYIEGVMDARFLLHGKRLAFTKNDENWFSDLNCLEALDFENAEDAPSGLYYEDYLMILMSLKHEKLYARMLDLMELNARQKDGAFRMESSVVSISVDMEISYQGFDASTNISMGY